MGVTKKPASICSDEILPIEVDEPREIETTIVIYGEVDVLHQENEEIDYRYNFTPDYETSELSEPGFEPIYISSDEPDFEPEYEPSTSSPSVPNNSSIYLETRYSNESKNDGINVDTKQLAFKKKNSSQMGRRKANRALNDHFLLSLSTDQQQHPEDEIFYNDNRNGFTKAINKLCIQPDLKESFIEGHDEVILQKSNKRSAAEMNNNKKSKRSIRPDVAFKNLTTSQKSLFKQKSLPFTAINHLETEVVRYFSRAPNGVYTSAPLPSYHRMLLHSIVRYYSLDATSVNSRGRRSQKIVQVRNSRFDDFLPPQMSLLKFITLI